MMLRPAAAVMLLNPENKVFVAQRLDSSMDAWQMPQGGLDEGEDPLMGALRELEEETGIAREKVDILARSHRELTYELPEDLRQHVWKGRWRGQRQWWFLARFLGGESDIDLQTAEPEFRAYKWVDPWLLPELIVTFKKQLYQKVLDEFAAHLPPRPA